MSRYTDEQIAAAAQTMYEALPTEMPEWHWSGVAKDKKAAITKAFAAGVATLPNHTTELLETIDRMREIDRIMERLDWYAEHGPAETHDKLCKQLDTLAAQIATAIANAKAHTKGGAKG